MTADVERVRALRAEGMTLRAIAREVGISLRGVLLALDPEGQKERERLDNARRNKAKQEAWRGVCGECGGETATRRSTLCASCREELEHRQRCEAVLEMLRLRRDEDLSNAEIAARLGVAAATVAQELYRLRVLGFDVPLAPYARARGRAPYASVVTADVEQLARALRSCGHEIPAGGGVA